MMPYSFFDPMMMDDDFLRRRQVGCKQECWPEYGMEFQDILAHNVHEIPTVFLMRVARIVDPSQVVRQRVQPHINGVLLVRRHSHTPRQARLGSANRNILIILEINPVNSNSKRENPVLLGLQSI